MYSKMCLCKILFGFGVIALSSGYLLCMPKGQKDGRDLEYADLHDVFLANQNPYQVHFIAENGNPHYGFFITRAGDQRTRDELCDGQITNRRDVVAVIRVLGRSMDDPSLRVRCADCELIGDPTLIQELLEYATAQAPRAGGTL